MDIKEIQNLIKFVSKSGVEEVKIEREDFKITIKTKKNTPQQIVVEELPNKMNIPTQVAVPVSQEIAQEKTPDVEVSKTEDSNHVIIKSPIIGTAYLAAEPGAKKFVEVGDKIKKGQTVMIVEAMKTMNHVPSTADGEVKKILVEDGQAVEFGQTLVILK